MYAAVTLPRITLYAQRVYRIIIGIKISVATNITDKVKWLEAASHTVKLERKSDDDGIINGTKETPAVPIIPHKARAEDQNAAKVLPLFANNHANITPI